MYINIIIIGDTHERACMPCRRPYHQGAMGNQHVSSDRRPSCLIGDIHERTCMLCRRPYHQGAIRNQHISSDRRPTCTLQNLTPIITNSFIQLFALKRMIAGSQLVFTQVLSKNCKDLILQGNTLEMSSIHVELNLPYMGIRQDLPN